MPKCVERGLAASCDQLTISSMACTGGQSPRAQIGAGSCRGGPMPECRSVAAPARLPTQCRRFGATCSITSSAHSPGRSECAYKAPASTASSDRRPLTSICVALGRHAARRGALGGRQPPASPCSCALPHCPRPCRPAGHLAGHHARPLQLQGQDQDAELLPQRVQRHRCGGGGGGSSASLRLLVFAAHLLRAWLLSQT